MTGLGVSARGSNDSWAGQCAHVEAQPLPANMGALLDRAVARRGRGDAASPADLDVRICDQRSRCVLRFGA